MGKRVREPRIDYDGRALVDSHGPHKPVRIVIHDTEGLDAPGIRDLVGLAEFFKRQGRGYGYHVAVDADGNSSRMVDDREIGWHLGGGNTGSLGVSMIAQARFTRPFWFTRPRQLHKVARWLAWWSLEHDIPLVKAKPREGDPGIGVLTHGQWSAASSKSDHTDPGAGFPFFYVLFWARRYAKEGWR